MPYTPRKAGNTAKTATSFPKTATVFPKDGAFFPKTATVLGKDATSFPKSAPPHRSSSGRVISPHHGSSRRGSGVLTSAGAVELSDSFDENDKNHCVNDAIFVNFTQYDSKTDSYKAVGQPRRFCC